MATVETPATNLGAQVPLDQIPISPEKENGSGEAAATNGSTAPANVQNSNEIITVFHDKDNFNVKHPLMNEWTLWFTKPPSGKVLLFPTLLSRLWKYVLTVFQDHNWNDLLKEVVTFDSVEEFWGIYASLPSLLHLLRLLT